MMYGPDIVSDLLKKSVKELKALAKAVEADISRCIEKKEIALLISKSELFQQRIQGEIHHQSNKDNEHNIQQQQQQQQQRRNRKSTSPAGAARNAIRSISQSRHQSGARTVSGADRKNGTGINSIMKKKQFKASDRNASGAVRTAARSVLHRDRHRASSAEPSARSSANTRNEAAPSSAWAGNRRKNMRKPGDTVRAAGRSFVNSKPNTAGYASPGRAASRNINDCVRCNKPVSETARITLKSTSNKGTTTSYVFHLECAMCCVCGAKIPVSGRGKLDATAFHMGHARKAGGGKGPANLYCRDHWLEHCAERCYCGCGQGIDPSQPTIIASGHRFISGHLKCHDCHKTINAKTKFGCKNGKYFCQRHYIENFGERCSVCNKALKKYIRTAASKQVLCTNCHATCPSCFSCSRVAAKETFKCYDDGRLACARCHSLGVHRHEEVVDGMAAVQAFFASLGMQSFQKQEFQFLKMRLLDRPDLMAMCKKNCHHASKKCPLGVTLSSIQIKKTYRCAGEDRRVLTDVQKMCKVQGIGVLKGLPRTHMTGVLAHELGHAFFTLHKFPHLPHHVNEGTCELWAYLWLNHLATTSIDPDVRKDASMHIERMKNNTDPVYGGGFRAALKGLSRVSNFIQFLRYVRRNKNFPS